MHFNDDISYWFAHNFNCWLFFWLTKKNVLNIWEITFDSTRPGSGFSTGRITRALPAGAGQQLTAMRYMGATQALTNINCQLLHINRFSRVLCEPWRGEGKRLRLREGAAAVRRFLKSSPLPLPRTNKIKTYAPTVIRTHASWMWNLCSTGHGHATSPK